MRSCHGLKWLAIAFLALSACQKSAQRPPLTVEAYVWQSPEIPAVQQAMNRATGQVGKFHVRAAELGWTGERFTSQRPLTKLPTPGCGLVVRIGASASQLEWTPEQIEVVAAVFRELARLGPSEIQCDFDCPQKRLSRYRVLLDALQAAAGKVPVLPTALPSWLDERSFQKLIEDRSGYVLQVHSLQLPKYSGDSVVIFDPIAARAAANKAAALRVPFRIAMATYGCEVRFDPDGKVTDVLSEDFASGTAATSRSFALADPVASAHLIREWQVNPPLGLRGIVWYRLPVEGDQRNWPWETFQLVIHGEQSLSTPGFEASVGSGARDLFVANHGRFPLLLPREIVVSSPVSAADGVGAYRLERRNEALHFIRRDDTWPWLDPGKKIPTGWLRISGESAPIEWHLTP